MAEKFSTAVVRWQRLHGRHDLPWQESRDPYRVWLSEIMLQQTQVATVRDYYTRFLTHLPTVAMLAAAPLDEVLGLWSGLGYYSRARNLHHCAHEIMQLHEGMFPRTALQLQTLPGIGRSTAAAIAALCFGERVAILDGNVARVLTRVLGFDLDLDLALNKRLLWDEATKLLPCIDSNRAMAHYTQGMMDLGATICTAKNPACATCPVAPSCIATRLGRPEQYPVKTRKLRRGSQAIWMLWAQTDDQSVWLAKRPIPGVWAGLYCFPLFESREALACALPVQCRLTLHDQPAFTHGLTHKDLYLHPIRAHLPTECVPNVAWVCLKRHKWERLGLPSPIKKLLLRG